MPKPVQPPVGEQLDLGLKVKPLEDWKLSRQQFEAKEDTVWRAEGAETLGESKPSLASGGLHFGTRQAAEERGGLVASTSLARQERGGPEARPVRMFSAKPVGKFSNKKDSPVEDKGNHWPSLKTGKWYRNEMEDPGSISGYVPRRTGFLETHKEIVVNAVQRGEHVHPAVQWEAEHAPEWSDTVQPHQDPVTRRRLNSPEARGQGNMFPHVISGGRSGNVYLTEDEFQAMRHAAKGILK